MLTGACRWANERWGVALPWLGICMDAKVGNHTVMDLDLVYLHLDAIGHGTLRLPPIFWLPLKALTAAMRLSRRWQDRASRDSTLLLNSMRRGMLVLFRISCSAQLLSRRPDNSLSA